MRTKSKAIELIVIMVVALMAAACNGTPSGVLKPDKMRRLLVDLHKGDAVVESNRALYNDDSLRRVFKQSVLQKHGVTPEELDSSMMWYGNHLDKYIEIYDGVIADLEEQVADAQKLGIKQTEPARMVVDGDSVNIWPGIIGRRFAPAMASDYITFALTSDRNWERGDSYLLRLKSIANNRPVDINIAADYTDGTTEYISRSLSGEGWKDLRLSLDSTKVAVNIYGAIHYAPAPGEVAYIDSISLVRTRIEDNRMANPRAAQKVVKTHL